MQLPRYLIVLICLLLISCRSEASSTESELMLASQDRGPAVISNNPNAAVKSWEYISPHLDEALTSFPSSNPETIKFGPDHYEAYIMWREGGFDIIWGNFVCSTQPVLMIEETTIALWLNDAIWDDCDAAEVIHAFKVELETDIPAEEWTYVVHQKAPPSP